MNEINYEEIAKQVMEGLNNSNNTNSILKNIIKCDIGSVILGRFVLYAPNPKNSIYHYFHHGWKTNAGQYVSYLCPKTHNERCPICTKSIQFWKSDDNFLKEASKKIRRKENWMVNFYVIDDNKNPDNNGKVKIFRFGQQIEDIVNEAMSGSDKEIYGKNIWRLDNGCSFRIQVKPNSDKKDAWPSYTSSKFLPASPISMSQEDVHNILKSTHDLTSIFAKLSEDELIAELQKNYIDDLHKEQSLMNSDNFGSEMRNTTNNSVRTQPPSNIEKPALSKPVINEPTNNTPSNITSQVDDEIDNLLKEL